MELSIIEVKARRNKLDVLAGSDYRDGSSELVKSLRKKGKDAYLGIRE